MSHMGETFAKICHTPSATAKRDSRAVMSAALNSNKKRQEGRPHE
jgi:hypothetical protein